MATKEEGHPKVGALIRARRRQQHMTLMALGEVAQVSVGYLSQVERDHATPSLGTLAQIAKALGVGIDYFVSAPASHNALTREGDRNRFSLDGSSIIYERLGADFPGNQLSSFLMTVPPGYQSETVAHEGEEILYVLEGEITQRLDGEEMLMKAGDSLHFRGNRPHSWSNHTNQPARLLWTGTLALFRSTARPRPVVAKPKAGANKPVRKNPIPKEKRT
ncbi:XRE family transcriptional regulator [Devosia sp. XJ19-1]|uniref:XRE family transcriptional regulator n=1 Tax=Devosia ureilytica TaxID=2952754 RepID=A0A9Q4AQL9_9HYPH|nr:XRE family transcriptional regulator [Devosia ureilytica]MCP8884358.1 XRE family transcriptional regulator [Devosia ureilytica]MCP8887966.1 XRE family transcriptional regulator [Devosia ureilytica]